MWTKPIEYGGVVGGTLTTQIDGATYYSGGSYEGRFNNAIIMNGILYYVEPLGHSGSGGGYTAVDLRTGEELWSRNDLGGLSATGYYTPISFGQLYDYEDINQHGVVGGVLWQTLSERGDPTATWNAYDGFTGEWMFNLTNVPTSGVDVYTDSGEIVKYILDADAGTLSLWNYSAAIDTRRSPTGSNYHQWRPSGKSIDTSEAYSWTVNVPDLSGNANPSIVAVLPGDIILGTSSRIQPSVFRMPRGTPDPYTVWAISDRPENRGELLWIEDYPAPPNTLSLQLGPVDPVNRVWTMNEVETFQWRGYSLDDGTPLWGPTNTAFHDMQYFGGGEGAGQRAVTAYGKLYVAGYAGEVFCYDTTNGNLVWRYDNTDSGLQTPWGHIPIFISAITDGKIYLFNNEHSPNSPLYKGYSIYCLNAENGNEIYKMFSWAGQTGGRGLSTSLLADGYLVYYNYYDNSVYCVGKGPSKTTVTVQDDVIAKGESVLIKGMVTDTASGTEQNEQAARFPNGVPAVADENMANWMEYVYMQKPCPDMVTGVPVHLTAYDSNGGMEDLGYVTSDGSGLYTKMWTPENEGEYKIVATFEGSKSYWTSYAETAIGVGAVSSGTPIEPEIPIFTTEVAIVLIVAVAAIVGVAAYVMLKRK
ncbi:MAG: PQQ-binding-like beta-propeller repeat protein [Candidatus Bathyarchaeota archaeon]